MKTSVMFFLKICCVICLFTLPCFGMDYFAYNIPAKEKNAVLYNVDVSSVSSSKNPTYFFRQTVSFKAAVWKMESKGLAVEIDALLFVRTPLGNETGNRPEMTFAPKEKLSFFIDSDGEVMIRGFEFEDIEVENMLKKIVFRVSNFINLKFDEKDFVQNPISYQSLDRKGFTNDPALKKWWLGDRFEHIHDQVVQIKSVAYSDDSAGKRGATSFKNLDALINLSERLVDKVSFEHVAAQMGNSKMPYSNYRSFDHITVIRINDL